MPWAAIASAVAPTIIGGLMGSEGSSQSQTQQNTIDPRMAKYIYGENGTGGLLSEANKWYENNKTGLNSQMLQGLNTQWNVLNNPETMGTYKQMQNLGSSLMSAPIAGNPFTDGRASLSGGSPNLGMGQRSQGGMGSMGSGMPQMQTMQGGNPMQGGLTSAQAMPQGGLMSGGSMSQMPQFQSFRNEGIGQPMPQQSPFTQPEWVTKPQVAAPAAQSSGLSPAMQQWLNQQYQTAQENAAAANRY